ncbi:hypothetical protein EJB05_42679, partial [Eragrostis curvula]
MKGTRSSGEKLWWRMLLIVLQCSRLSSSSPPPIAATGEHVVTHLPGFEGPLPFSLRTGYLSSLHFSIPLLISSGFLLIGRPDRGRYVEVDEGNGVRLFYYFTPPSAPLPTTLSCSGSAAAQDARPSPASSTRLVRPFDFDLHGSMDGHVLPKLVYRPESWTKWFDEHPEFLSNPLYIAGDSYSGMIVPTVTSELAKGTRVGSEPALNLKGYLVGNLFTDSNIDEPSKIPFAHRMGLISDDIYECVKDIFPFHILEPNCAYASPHAYSLPNGKLNSGILEMRLLQEDTAEGVHMSEISTKCRTAEYTLSRFWANDAAVREALGIHKGTVPIWLRCNADIQYSKDIPSSVKYHLDVTTKGYRSLVYSGDHDMAVPYVGTQSWIKSLNFSIVDNWRPWYLDGQVAGYARSYSNNLTFATVKGAGHTAPEYMPRQCLAMFSRWLAGDPL